MEKTSSSARLEVVFDDGGRTHIMDMSFPKRSRSPEIALHVVNTILKHIDEGCSILVSPKEDS